MLRARRTRGSGGTGRRARLRGVWFTPYGFKSRFPHQKKQVGISLPAFFASRNGQCKPVSALAVWVRLRSKGTIEQSEICSTVPFPNIRVGKSLPAFFASRNGQCKPVSALAVRVRLRSKGTIEQSEICSTVPFLFCRAKTSLSSFFTFLLTNAYIHIIMLA